MIAKLPANEKIINQYMYRFVASATVISTATGGVTHGYGSTS
eukprot:COSAG01_NODE_1375_length_10536_cov_6.860880_1_plen_42_part_00